MRRRGRGRHGHKSFKIPIITIGILAGQAGAAWNFSGGNLMRALDVFQNGYTGYDFSAGNFEASRLVRGYAPWLVKGFITKIARPLGALPRVPKGLPISLS